MSAQAKKAKKAHQLLDQFIVRAKKIAPRHPSLVVMLLHEYFRNIWANDPFIAKRYAANRLDNITRCLTHCIAALDALAPLGSYYPQAASLPQGTKKDAPGVYGPLWEKLNTDYVKQESAMVLKNLFKENGQDAKKMIRGKRVLDMGCGSGRFTLGFVPLGASEIIGIDLGEQGIAVGKKITALHKLTNVTFTRGDVLNLPFSDESFDFVFCKGVIHHTGNREKGLHELARVLKKGGSAFLYMYGSGGIFWTSREKMREVTKHIPMEYAVAVLDMLGMPPKRYIFADSWYVPVEDHTNRAWLEKHLAALGFSKIMPAPSNGDRTITTFPDTPEGRLIWGDGELRYFLTK